MRHLRIAAVAAAVALMVFSVPAMAGSGAQTQPDDGWKVVIYPIYGWAPIHRATTRLPEVPESPEGGGPTVPEAESDSSLEQAILAAFRVEKGRFSLEGGFLYAGLEGEAERPLLKLEVNTTLADLRAGFEVVPDLYLEAGARYLALDMAVTIGDYPRQSWKPDMLEPVVGITYRPPLGKHWRLVLHADAGGFVTGDSSTAVATARVEWQPLEHFVLVAGGTAMYLSAEGSGGSRDVKLEQTLYGPVIGIGIPF